MSNDRYHGKSLEVYTNYAKNRVVLEINTSACEYQLPDHSKHSVLNHNITVSEIVQILK